MSLAVDHARELVQHRRPAGSWQRAAGLLLRQALEEAEAAYWPTKKVPTMADAKQRHQLIALPHYLLGEGSLPNEVRYAWNRLTVACHAGARVVLPSADELLDLADIVDRLEAASTDLRRPKGQVPS
jgi:hypothetical protein